MLENFYQHLRFLVMLSVLPLLPASGQSPEAGGFVHFEARQTHPIGVTPDGRRLLAVNSTEGRLSVFDVTQAAQPAPILLAEIPVGLEPVSVRARTPDEVWVVNELSDSVSIVSLTLGVTVATLTAPDEPADVVFAGGYAFVSGARAATVRVFDAQTYEPVVDLPLVGDSPRALATDPEGTRVFVAFQLSGNRTTTLPRTLAPAPPPPANAALPPAPRTGLIVPADDPRVPYTVLDHDVAEIDTTELRVVAYHSDVATNLFDLAVHPADGAVWVAGTVAHNLTRFEPALRGRFAANHLIRLTIPDGDATGFDLNPGVADTGLPNPAAQTTALAQPMAVAFADDGQSVWVAAFGSDRIARVSTADGFIQSRIDLRTDGGGARTMRGPRGLATHPAHPRLYVFNKLSNTISVIHTSAVADAAAVVAEVPVASHDPMPPIVKQGRGFLFDARLSGHGTVSCATCHLDADRDGLAWDLGDPNGEMMTVMGRNNSIHDPTPRPRVLHPMKGPMTTQTLRGMQLHKIFHWRGDRPTIASFNATFRDLLGGTVLTDPDMEALTAYLLSLRHHPNPNRQLDRSLPASFAGGNPIRGRDHFNDHPKSHCVTCHALPAGSDENIDLMGEVGASQPIKTVPLRTVYQRTQFDGTPGGVTFAGFGLLHDGTGFRLPRGHFYVLDSLDTLEELRDVTAFLLCFDTGTAPTVGFSRTVDSATAASPSLLDDLQTLESQAAVAACDTIVRGRLAGRWHQWVYDPAAHHYRHSRAPGGPGLTRAQLIALLTPGDALTFLGVPPGQGTRLGTDRNSNEVADIDEPAPPMAIDILGTSIRIVWPSPSPDWLLEAGMTMDADWQPLGPPTSTDQSHHSFVSPFPERPQFFRLRRTW